MLKVAVICELGMTSSLIMTKMEQAATAKGIELEVNAYPLDEIGDHLDVDAILVSPQVRFRMGEVQKVVGDRKIAVELIPIRDYGMGKGDKILDLTVAAVEKL